jgi:sRNA-binding regulator protein Hfq
MAIVEDLAKIEYRKNGVALTEVKINQDRLEAEVTHFDQFTVVGQSVRANSTVLRGTVVDVTVTSTRKLSVGIIAEAPERWQEFEIGKLADQVRGSPPILKVMADKETFEQLDELERRTLVTFLQNNKLPVEDNELPASYGALRSSHLLSD